MICTFEWLKYRFCRFCRLMKSTTCVLSVPRYSSTPAASTKYLKDLPSSVPLKQRGRRQNIQRITTGLSVWDLPPASTFHTRFISSLLLWRRAFPGHVGHRSQQQEDSGSPDWLIERGPAGYGQLEAIARLVRRHVAFRAVDPQDGVFGSARVRQQADADHRQAAAASGPRRGPGIKGIVAGLFNELPRCMPNMPTVLSCG